ncbi:RlpB protein [Moritella sp. 24]|uniref:LPS-assembly lipoprotein LptE n=1 Tax=Moritella sp. 24 TaxID=2746230 RepID=UPI001BA9B77B|nr:LPS assembly lipoprotein LptE [Moritella sp. 24]QUM75320.1 RlpB protein [Moritella sp. 24]
MIASSQYQGFTRLICIFLFTAMLGGCGFHLKNSEAIPSELSELTLVSTKYSELTRLIKTQLRYNQINLTTSPTLNTPILKIVSETTDTRTVSLYSDATAAEYELSYVLKMEVRLPDQDPQFFTIALQRDQLNNSQEALARSREAELLKQELREAAAQQVVRTLSQVIIEPKTEFETN